MLLCEERKLGIPVRLPSQIGSIGVRIRVRPNFSFFTAYERQTANGRRNSRSKLATSLGHDGHRFRSCPATTFVMVHSPSRSNQWDGECTWQSARMKCDPRLPYGLPDVNTAVIDRWFLSLSQIKVVPGVTQLSGLGQCALLDEILQISCRCGTGCSGYADIILCA